MHTRTAASRCNLKDRYHSVAVREFRDFLITYFTEFDQTVPR